MKDTLRKGFLIGFGITALAAEKMEKEVKKLLKDAEMTRPEAEAAARDFLKDVKKRQQKVMKTLQKEMKEAEASLRKQAAKSKSSAKRKTVKKSARKKAGK